MAFEVDELSFEHPVQQKRRNIKLKLISGVFDELIPDHNMVKAIAQAHRWMDDIKHGIPLFELRKKYDVPESTLRHRIGLACLSPSITQAILEGRQPVELTLRKLVRTQIPMDWKEQEKVLGFRS